MKNVFKVVLLFVLATMAGSCHKDDDIEQVPLRDYAVQYATDIEAIKTFLKTHSITTTNAPGLTQDQDVTFTTVTALAANSIWGTNDATHNANVLELPVQKDGITYIIYYLQLRQGSGPESKSPCNLDGILAAYKGRLMNDEMTVFDSNDFPQSFFTLSGLIRGWSEIFPKFKTGTYLSHPDGSVEYNNFGAGVMFLPSGMAYYGGATASGIPAYSPLIFNFKLFEVQRIDNDGDGIFSYQEDLNGDGYIRDYDDIASYEDDTDHDGVPNAFDIDDDADGTMTKDERKYVNPADPSHTVFYYPYEGAAVDDPATLYIDETKGLPRKFTVSPVPPATMPTPGTGDFTDPARLRRHLDATAKPPYFDQIGL